MNYKDVELTTGRTVRVYMPPTIRIHKMLEGKYPTPQKKIVTEKTASGGTVSVIIDDDPEWERAVEERDAKADAEYDELNILFSLKDEEVPDDWSMEGVLSILQYSNPDLKAREGVNGRRLDWIEWELLASPVDYNRVQQALYDMTTVDMEAVDQIEASFRSEVEGEGA